MSSNTIAPARTDSFERQLADHMDILYLAALRLTRNAADAQDLRQDALVRALRFHHKYTPGTYIRAWLLTILRNTFINDYRRCVRRPQPVELTGRESDGHAVVDPVMQYFPRELQAEHVLEFLDADVRQAVEALPPGHRRAVIMADLQDMSYKEIAASLGCPLGTVMSRLHRGRRLLRESLKSRRETAAYN